MSLKGRYIPDRVIEIPMGNGMTELIDVPIKAFDINREKVIEVVEEPKKDKRAWIRWSIVVASFLLGAALGAILQQNYFCIPLFVTSLGWISLVAFANRRG